MRKVFLLSMLLSIIMLASCGPAKKKEIVTDKSIENIVQQSCSSCHSLKVGDTYIAVSEGKPEVTLMSGKTREEWERTVLRMINEYNCQIDQILLKDIVEYLYEKAGPNITGKDIPDSDRELVEIACGTCHGIVIIDVDDPQKVIKRVTKSELGGDIRIPAGKENWEATVIRMIEKNGCAIPGGVGGEVFNRIVNWLNTNVGSNIGKHLNPSIATGKELTEIYCSACHGITINGIEITKAYWDIELPANKDKKGWRTTVEKMIYKNNCPVPGGAKGKAVEKIVNYLSTLDIPEPNINSYTGEELVNMFCNQCHGLVVGNERLTANSIGVDVVLLDGKAQGFKNDWAFTVSRMIEMNGCPLPGGVNDCAKDPNTPFCKIVTFLETNYGQGCCGDVSSWDDEKLVKSACGSCHGIRGYSKVVTVGPGLDMWLFDGKTQSDWEMTISRMINVNGALIPDGSSGSIASRIAQWLAINAGPDCCGYIPTTEPELIAQAACGTCHGIVIGSKNNNKRLTWGMSLYMGVVYGWNAMPLGKDEIHWTKTINRMILRRLVTRGSNPDLQQKKAMIDWFVKEAGVGVYNNPGEQGLRDPIELYMTYCHKCHGPRARGTLLNTLNQWVTNTQLGDIAAIGDFGPNDLGFMDAGYMAGWWWPPAGDFLIMPYYMWHKYSYGFIDRRVYPDEWNMLRAMVSSLSMKYSYTVNVGSDLLPPEGDSDGDGNIDYPMDITPPPAPSQISVSVKGKLVTVRWIHVNQEDLNGYLLFYSPVLNCSSDCSSCSNWIPIPIKNGNPDTDVSYQMLLFDNSFTLELTSGHWCIAVAAVDYTCPRPRPLDQKDPLNICGFNLKTVGPINIP